VNRLGIVSITWLAACGAPAGDGPPPWSSTVGASETDVSAEGTSDSGAAATDDDDDGPAETSAPDDDGDEGSSGAPPAVCESDAIFPGDEWELGDPSAHGLDLALLDEAAEWADDNESRCLLVIKDGVLVYERYFADASESTPVKSWSIAKSHTSTAVGIALARGELGSVDDSIAEYLPELAGTDKAAITLAHLLSMTAGLYSGVLDDMAGMFGAMDMTQKALDTPLDHPPGSEWHYSNIAVQMFDPILRAATGMPVDEYVRMHVWDRIGMEAEWFHDPAGNPALYMNVLATCRDHARFGYLYLQRGCWAGEQVVPREWIDQATTASTDHNLGYGWFWWKSGGEPTLDLVDGSPLDRGTLHPGGPADSFCAVGLGGQVIEVVPAHDMVVVRTGIAAVESLETEPFPLLEIFELLGEGEQELHDEIVQRVLAAVIE
jgi:CubicO group peptidase (beta-lactamase class C family)